jgi:gliding motility-associated-like protein
MNKLSVLILSVVLCANLFAQEEIWIHPNRGQWHQNISYQIDIPGGDLYLEKDGFTYNLNNLGEAYDHHHHGEDHEEFEGHVVKTKFIGANLNPIFEELDVSSHYENYFLGNDTSKWKSNIYAYNRIDYHELYDGIRLSMYEQNATLKYDIHIDAGTNPSIFKVDYEGQDELTINDDGELVIHTPLGDITESKPYAYQHSNGIKKNVPCEYVLIGNQMHFEFPEGYDSNLELVIDPELAFSTFTGSASDNWGMTACPDINKNLIAGGIVFGSQYINDPGGYDNTFNGGQVDVVITKYNATGSNFIFSTHLGGDASETPHSLIVNDNNELYIMGATASTNFPVMGNAMQPNHEGGVTITVDGITFVNGSDIFVTKLNSAGSAMLGSTFYGGSLTDGMSTASDDIAFNYGDQLRGEVMVDDASNVYISSTTQSNDIQINGGFQNSFGGTQDAIIAKFNPDLSTLMWSTYVGGTGAESGNSIQLTSTGDIVIGGGTTSSNFPNTAGQVNPSFQGGNTDGYVMKFNAPTYNAPIASYIGTSDYDQTYFVQIDIDDFIYLYGQTKGDYTISSGVYNNPNSGQFIHKLSNDLSTTEWSSSFGASSGNEELSPTAFLVSDCYEIYIAGWGGNTNANNSSADNSSSNGMPITSDAFQPTTNGSNFYLALFTADMADLKYSTYMGSQNGSSDHVDGGTSRFDKQGGVYHAVCAACGGNANGFPTTPGAYSETNQSSNCNMAAFLFELSKIEATLSTGTPVVCIPDPVIFQNDSENGDTYEWVFGDGSPNSFEFEPTHYYTDPGTYEVMLIVSDAAGCYSPDTAYLEVEIQLLEAEAGALLDTICPGSSVELYAIGGDNYVWGPAEYLNTQTGSNVVATIWEATTFTVEVQSVCGSSEIEVTVEVYGANAESGLDTAICVGGSAQLSANGGGTYEWSPGGSLDDPLAANPISTPSITTNYIVTITTPEGCEIVDTTQVWVDQDLPFPLLPEEVSICYGSSTQIIAGGATSYLWSPDYNISETNVYNPFVNPLVDTIYHVDFTNACGTTYDSVKVNVITVDGTISPDTTICPEGEATLVATGGVSYNWWPSTGLNKPNDSITQASPGSDTQYTVLITDEFGCSISLTTNVFLYDTPQLVVSPAVYAVVGDSTQLWAEGDGVIYWSPPYNISCAHCTDPYVWPEVEFVYTATITDVNGCMNTGDVPIYFDPLIYVPNAFTPNGDSFNQYFKAQGLNIIEFEMLIFNRWGEIVKTLSSLDESWDGTYNGVPVKDDVYVWQVRYVDLKNDPHTLRGHVTVLK